MIDLVIRMLTRWQTITQQDFVAAIGRHTAAVLFGMATGRLDLHPWRRHVKSASDVTASNTDRRRARARGNARASPCSGQQSLSTKRTLMRRRAIKPRRAAQS